MQKTTMLTKKQAEENRKWYVIDAAGMPLGRISTHIADLLRGKKKVDFTPNQDCGDFVIVVNSDKIILTGSKAEKTKWYNYSGYKGGLRTRTGKTMLENYSDELLRRSVKGMLPHNKLSNKIITKLFVYKGSEHEHSAQQPAEFKIELR